MASNTVKKVQERLFGGKSSAGNTSSGDPTGKEGDEGERRPIDGIPFPSSSLSQNSQTPLSIQIPKSGQPPTPPPRKNTDASPRSSDAYAPPRPFRQRLAEELDGAYKGAEKHRLSQDDKREKHWKRWGPYLSDRQWATVREDYSADGDAWSHFPHEHARSRAYRWGEDGIAGLSDNHQRLCLALSLWNGEDPILKERLFGVTGHQGNHGEDVKELYYYLDSTPTHSYMKFLYKYPQRRYPYEELVAQNRKRNREEEEFEILDTDAFDDDRYWDVFVEYAKDEENSDNIYMRITSYNRGPDPATLHVIPQLWFPNTWSWPRDKPPMPSLSGAVKGSSPSDSISVVTVRHPTLGKTHLYCLPSPPPVGPSNDFEVDPEHDVVQPSMLFTENNTNFSRLYGGNNETLYVKDAFHDHIIPSHRPNSSTSQPEGFFSHRTRPRTASMYGPIDEEEEEREQGPCTPFPLGASFVNPDNKGTKFGAHYVFRDVPGHGGCAVVRLKLTPARLGKDISLEDEVVFDDVVEERRQEADEFYGGLIGVGGITGLPGGGGLTGFGMDHLHQGSGLMISEDLKQIMRQAFGGMLWTKQYYRFIQKEWLEGDPAQPPPPPNRKWIRNKEWKHMHIEDILSMPDKWEYPFFAAWDTAFHCIPLAVVDPSFAKKQLDLLTREWYMNPNGQIPAYEWNFSDVNPPVHAWATFRIFKIERKLYGREDLEFLERVFQKLLLNFTWWVNRKDQGGNNVFEGGFLGLDNIGAFNRSEPLPTGGNLRQADGTAWMAFYCLNMLSIALELAKHNPVYEDIASKFFEHFIFIADAMTYREGDNEESLWNDKDGMYYDAISFGPGNSVQLPVRSLVGLIPLYGTLVLEPATINRFPGFKKRMEWFIDNRPAVSARNMANMKVGGKEQRRLLALASKERLTRILEKMLDEDEFLGDHGIRSLSKRHEKEPWGMDVHGQRYEVGYWPGDSKSGMFGGNSNWRGPIWLATNFLLIESLQRFYQYYGDDLQVECPTGSGFYMNLASVAEEIQHRIIHIFGRDMNGRRATNGGVSKLDYDPHFRDYVWFYEFFNGDTGKGLGASHQTGWSGLVAYHILQSGVTCRLPKTPRTPRSVLHHYFDETLSEARSRLGSEFGGATPSEAKSAYSGFSSFPDENNTLYDISPEAL